MNESPFSHAIDRLLLVSNAIIGGSHIHPEIHEIHPATVVTADFNPVLLDQSALHEVIEYF
jgi:hypothetical protein